jgi:TRAP-type C4-dicarboxylate transport system permease large subunit
LGPADHAPIGMNLFVIFDVAMDLDTCKMMRGVVPFIICDIVRVILLVAFPFLATWLPSTIR